jgi:hypothetical protein
MYLSYCVIPAGKRVSSAMMVSFEPSMAPLDLVVNDVFDYVDSELVAVFNF